MSGPIVSCGWLAERLGDPGIRVVDTRWFLESPGEGRRRYEAGRIPGAVYMDIDEDLAGSEGPGRHPLPAPEAFAEALSRRGIGKPTPGGGLRPRPWVGCGPALVDAA